MALRYTLTKEQSEIEQSLGAKFQDNWIPTYNASPLNLLPIITQEDPKQILSAQFGFIPAHAQDPKSGLKYPLATPRDCSDYPPFRAAFKHRRCIVITDGYYAWKKVRGGYIPFRVEHKKKELLLLAGLYNIYLLPDGRELYSFCVLLTKPNAKTSKFQSPMPYILASSEVPKYLAHAPTTIESPQASPLRVYLVDTDINNSENNYPSLIEPHPEVVPAKYHPQIHKA